MTIPTQFANWLAVADRDGRGGLSAEFPSISRGRTRVVILSLGADTTYGDWTSGTFAARLRASPDAGGAALATYTCVTGTPSGGVTPITLTLEDTAQGSLPANNPEEGVIELYLEVVYTPTGGDPITIISTRQLVSGVI